MTKRLLLSLVSIAAVAGLVAGGTLALFSNQISGNDTWSAGTVTLGEITEIEPCQLPDLWAPGDEFTCDFEVTYIGSLDAWVGVQLVGQGGLFDKAKNGIRFDVPTALRQDENGIYVLGLAEPDKKIPVSVKITFPIEAGNDLQGAKGTVIATLKAVQAKHNTNAAQNGPVAWN